MGFVWVTDAVAMLPDSLTVLQSVSQSSESPSDRWKVLSRDYECIAVSLEMAAGFCFRSQRNQS